MTYGAGCFFFPRFFSSFFFVHSSIIFKLALVHVMYFALSAFLSAAVPFVDLCCVKCEILLSYDIIILKFQ